MNWYDAMEEAYNKGYRKGLEDAQKNVRHGRWIIRSSGKGGYATNWAECSWCHVCGNPQWKVCPVCETKMDIMIERSCEICANDGLDIPQCKECPGSGFLWFREKV